MRGDIRFIQAREVLLQTAGVPTAIPAAAYSAGICQSTLLLRAAAALVLPAQLHLWLLLHPAACAHGSSLPTSAQSHWQSVRLKSLSDPHSTVV
jgi:hypothetical protein